MNSELQGFRLRYHLLVVMPHINVQCLLDCVRFDREVVHPRYRD